MSDDGETHRTDEESVDEEESSEEELDVIDGRTDGRTDPDLGPDLGDLGDFGDFQYEITRFWTRSRLFTRGQPRSDRAPIPTSRNLRRRFGCMPVVTVTR